MKSTGLHTRWLIVLLLAAPALAQQAPSPAGRESTPPREFAYGVHLKPKPIGVSGVVETFGPLVVREVVSDQDLSLAHGANGGCAVQTFARRYWLIGQAADLRLVRGGSSSVHWQGTEYTQVFYSWTMRPQPAHRQSTDINSAPSAGREVAVRITLGQDGFPVVWEVLDPHQPVTALYVSRSAEFLARRQFGDHLPGRQFAIERATAETPGYAVHGTIEDGPMPLGPYIYFTADGHVADIICRCMPAQVREFLWEGSYELHPMNDDEQSTLKTVDLSSVLRWPHGL